MFNKDIEVPYITPFDEPSINLVRPGYREKLAETKVAPEIYKELEDFKGEPGKSYMLVVAVSPVEYWGDNKNKDAFEEHWLKKKHHTFTQDGTFFKNHVNKDPNNNYGDNELSWYDDLMKRVLVLVGVDHKKAPDIVDAMESGQKISVSMGCRIASDICSICGNKAPTRADYCDHMKYQAGEILPDGRKVFVFNPDPTFFDLSKVIRPAGHIEYMIKHVKPKSFKEAREDLGTIWTPGGGVSRAKVASILETIDVSDKLAELGKLSTIYKVVDGESVSPEEMDPKLQKVIQKSKKIINITEPKDIDTKTLDELSTCPLKNVMSTSNLLGIKFKLPEIVRMLINRMEEDDVSSLMDGIPFSDLNPFSFFEDDPFTALRKRPQVLKIIIQSKIMDGDTKDVDEKVASLLTPYVTARSIYPVFMEKRAGSLDVIPAYDNSGGKYLTTRESINRTHEMSALKNLAKAVGLGGALAATSVAALKMPVIGSKYLLPASIFGTLWGANKLNESFSPEEMSRIPAGAAFKKIGKLLDTYDWERFDKIANEYQTAAYEVAPMTQPNFMQRAMGWAKDNPEWATLAGLLGTGIGLKGGTKLVEKVAPLFGKISPKVKNVNVSQALSREKDMAEIGRFLKYGPKPSLLDKAKLFTSGVTK